jgi:hypothetical protein
VSAQEGVSRIATTVRLGGYWIGGATIALGLYASKSSQTSSDGSFFLWAGVIIGALIAGGGHVLAWIIDGFARNA